MMAIKLETNLDLERVWELYQLKGMTVKIIAKTMNVDPVEIKAALTLRARGVRKMDRAEAAREHVVKNERLMFNKAFPNHKDNEDELWQGWLARSKLKG